MPQLFANPFRWAWVARACMAAYLGLIAADVWRAASFREYGAPLYLLIMMVNLLNLGRYRGAYVLLDDVLALPGIGADVRNVPLTVVEVRKGWLGWTFRWKEGRGNQSVWCAMPAVLRGPVEAAMSSRPEHPAKTAKEAAARLRVTVLPTATNVWVIAWLVLLVVAAVAGLGPWHFAIPMVVLAVFTLFVPFDAYPSILAWTGETLWILRRKAEPYAIPLEKVTEMRTSRAKGSRIFTTDPAYPVIRFYANDTDFQKAFERRLAGEPAAAPPAEAPLLRCSLCGTPAPGHVPAVGAGVYICETCANRARLEASEGGHGLAPKDPKPM